MKLLFVLSMLCAVTGRSTRKGFLTTGRIVGGVEVNPAMFPFMVSIQMLSEGKLWRQHCGGSIVSQTLILTACHCITEKTSTDPIVLLNPISLRIIAGVGDVNLQSPYRQELNVVKIIPHPRCKSAADGGYFSDSALLILERPLSYNPEVEPLKLFENDPFKAVLELQNLIGKEASCTIAGWGLTSAVQEGDFSKLNFAEVTLMTPQQCKTAFCHLKVQNLCSRDFSELNQFCAIGSKHATFCFGDTGGPIICNRTLFGIMSRTSDNCAVDWPGVYADSQVIADMIGSHYRTPDSY